MPAPAPSVRPFPPSAAAWRPEDTRFAASLLAFLCALGVTVCTCWALAAWYGPVAPPDAQEVAKLFSARLEDFQPEPVERLLYMASLLVFPLALYAFRAVLRRVLARWPDPAQQTAVYGVAYAGVALAVVLLLMCGALAERHDQWARFMARGLAFRRAPSWLVLGLAGWTGLFFLGGEGFLASRPVWRRGLPRVVSLLAWVPLSVFFLMGSFEVYPYFGGTGNGHLIHHFNAVFHGVVQVYLGQALLVDLNHQYGLYPHFIEPLFRVVGLSAAGFAILMAALNTLSMYLLYRVTREAGRNAVLAWGGLALQVLVLYLPRFLDNRGSQPEMEAYYQFHPVRFLFPCLSMYLCWRYFSAPRAWLYWVCWAVFAAAVLWNVDTGLVVFAAWLIVLAYDELCVRPWRAALLRACVHALKGGACLAGAFLFFALYIRARYGAWPDFLQSVEYQSIFYLYGFYMLPMPLLGVWCWVALTYAFGLLHACQGLHAGQREPRRNLVLYVTVLGCGVFSYYQGRSHIYCLMAVLYPAIVLWVLYADAVFATLWARKGMRLGHLLLAAAVFVTLGTSVVEMGLRVSDMFRPGVRNLKLACEGKLGGETRHAEFLRRSFRPGDKAFILSLYSGLYHLESRTLCPLRIPGPTELILQRDWDEVRAWLARPHPGQKMLLDGNYLTPARIAKSRDANRDGAFGRYRIVDVDPTPLVGPTPALEAYARRAFVNLDVLLLEGPDEFRPGEGPAWLEFLLGQAPGVSHHYRVDGRTGGVYSREAGLEGRWNAEPVDVPPEFTLEVLVYPPAPEGVESVYLLGNVTDSSLPAGFQVWRTGNTWEFKYGDGRRYLARTHFDLPPGQWSFFAVAVSRQHVRVFANGVLSGELEVQGTIGDSRAPVLVGPGVEEVRLRDSALAPAELEARWKGLVGRELHPLRLAPAP